jgi:hypothetical protein
MHVREHPVVPYKAGALDAPGVPAVVAFFGVVLVKGEPQFLDAANGLDEVHDFVPVFFAEGVEQGAHHAGHLRAL